jgi:phage shock protein PspC (stress-responsive transcriptional regulator)/predicted membrane protein
MVEASRLADALAMTTQATTPTPEPPVSRRLTRSSDDRVIAGVAGGLGRYMGVDPVVIRIALVVLMFFGGAGFIAYAAAWLLIPSDKDPHARFSGRDIARRTGIVLAIAVATVIVAFGGAWGVAVGGGTATAIVIIVAGVALVAGAVTGGMRWLIVPALALALSAGAVAAADVDARGGVGERIYTPASTDDLRSEYKLGVGHLGLDLRHTRFTPGEHRVHLKLGVGGAEVFVPDDVCVSSSAQVSAGATEVFNRETGGLDHDWQDTRTAAPGTKRLIVDADIGAGALRIQPGPGERSIGNLACARG